MSAGKEEKKEVISSWAAYGSSDESSEEEPEHEEAKPSQGNWETPKDENEEYKRDKVVHDNRPYYQPRGTSHRKDYRGILFFQILGGKGNPRGKRYGKPNHQYGRHEHGPYPERTNVIQAPEYYISKLKEKRTEKNIILVLTNAPENLGMTFFNHHFGIEV